MDGQLEALTQDIGSVKDEIAKTRQDLAAAEQARNNEDKRVLLDLLLNLSKLLLCREEQQTILLRRQAPSVSQKVLDVHVLVNAKEDLKMRSEYDIPAGVVRFRDSEKSFGVKVLE